MPPLIPRRRSRRRSVSGRVVLLICALVVTALLIGGLTQIGRQSGPYDAALDRSFAAQGAVVADDSNATASQVRHLMATMQRQGRPGLQAALDAVVQQTADQASRALTIGVPAPPAGVQAAFAGVFSDRAQAVRALRASIDGLLGMRPLPALDLPAGAGSGTPSVPSTRTATLLSSTAATDRIAAAGALLVRADRQYQSVRHTLARADGHARLPTSTWVTRPQSWQIGPVATELDRVTASTTLAAVHRLVLRAVRLTPAALPSPTGATSSSVSVLSPTRTVSVSVVLSNVGSVEEPHASVQFTLTPLLTGAGPPVTKSRSSALLSGGSVTLDPVTFAVTPGHSYQLSVAIVLPGGQSDTTGSSLTKDLQIAPGT